MSEIINQERLRLYLIRHGEVEAAGEGRLLGRTDTPLSKFGISQAQHLAEQLAEAQLTAVYSSDLQRASVTAAIIAGRHNLQGGSRLHLAQIDMGEWEGRTLAALHREDPEPVAAFRPASFQYPCGESFAHFIKRLQTGVDRLRQIIQCRHSAGARMVASAARSWQRWECRLGIGCGWPRHTAA
jgi:broad specificity phosphatase PhoE